MESSERNPPSSSRKRLSRQDRYRQLIDAAWRLVREEGTDALSLGRLAERAGVTKPVVYDHFGTRGGLLAALYGEFDARQTRIMDEALSASEPSMPVIAGIIASSYVNCVLTQGQEIPGVAAALSGSPELNAKKREYDDAFMDKCRGLLAPFVGQSALSAARMRAMVGAAEALSGSAATGELSAVDAVEELRQTILAMVERAGKAPSPD